MPEPHEAFQPEQPDMIIHHSPHPSLTGDLALRFAFVEAVVPPPIEPARTVFLIPHGQPSGINGGDGSRRK